MEDFLKYLIPKLVDDKDEVKIDSSQNEGVVVFTITCSKDDMGKVIGKEGKIINSIRNLIKILAVKEKKKVIVQISEPLS